MGNLLRGFLVGQLFIVLEGLTPFKMSLASALQSLSTFKRKIPTVMINDYEFQSSSDDLTVKDRKDGKVGYIILHDIDPLIRIVENFTFTVAYILWDNSFAKLQYQSASDILAWWRL